MSLRSPADLAERCQPIELLVTDVDGVMTDGKIVLDDRGIETKHFHVRDGLAFSLWHKAGKHAAILSGRKTAAVDLRAAEPENRPCASGARTEGGPASYSHRTTRSLAPASLLRGRRPS